MTTHQIILMLSEKKMFSYSTDLLRRLSDKINEERELAELAHAEEQMCSPAVWVEETAQLLVKKTEHSRSLIRFRHEAGSINLMSEALDDPGLRDEAQSWFAELSIQAERVFNPSDHAGAVAIVTITAGAGGEDARDFTAMSLREICAYALNRELSFEIQDETYEGQGIREATIRISGEDAFMIMRGEAGKRRLVRNSPFGSGGRQTSFCVVTCMPEIRDDEMSTIPTADIRCETYRDTGPGGQHRNTTDSAVRLTHIPTGITAKSAMRSQHENKRIAMVTLISRLAQHRRSLRDSEASSLREGDVERGFGGHTRTIVLSPYKLVRNELTGISSAAVEDYLRGGLPDVRANFDVLCEKHETSGFTND